MKIAKIVSSNSHIAYIARALDEKDGLGIPDAESYGFGRFVTMDLGDEKIVGVVCDSRLVNPEYSNFSPRIAQTPALGELKRELVNEQKALIAILLLGKVNEAVVLQEIPHRIIPSGQIVETMEMADAVSFHRNGNGEIHMHYLPDLMAQSGSLAVPLVKTIVTQLSPHCSESDRQRLDVMVRSISWKHTFGENRF